MSHELQLLFHPSIRLSLDLSDPLQELIHRRTDGWAALESDDYDGDFPSIVSCDALNLYLQRVSNGVSVASSAAGSDEITIVRKINESE